MQIQTVIVTFINNTVANCLLNMHRLRRSSLLESRDVHQIGTNIN